MFYGMKFYNDLLMEAGPLGNVQSEVLLRKDQDTFTFKQGWAFPPMAMNVCFPHLIHIHFYQALLMQIQLQLQQWQPSCSYYYCPYGDRTPIDAFWKFLRQIKLVWLWDWTITDNRYMHCQF